MKTTTVLILILFSSGCVKFALRSSPSLIAHFSDVIFEECDTNLAEASIPADLKLMEGLLKSDPKNTQLLTTLSMGFAGYSLLFVENKNQKRASQLYLRARNYGFMALAQEGYGLKEAGSQIEKARSVLNGLGKGELKPLFWSTFSWLAWINLNLDKPAALAQLGSALLCLERILQIDGSYFYGAPYVLMGSTLAARPEFMGGDAQKARSYFEKAMTLSEGRFFLVHYQFARYYAVRVQNRELFTELLRKVLDGSPTNQKELCLINSVLRHKANDLLKMTDELFF